MHSAMRWSYPIFRPAKRSKDQAVRTVCFTDLLLLRAYLGDRRAQRGTAQPLCITKAQGERFMQQLGFAPTGAQRRVMRQIQEDLAKTVPMSRLVQGDVGCGKTVVAFYAMWIAVQNGRQAALMAPTDILAGQHYEQAKALFEPLGVSVGLLKSGMKAAERRQVLEALEDGALDLVVGTHALISESVKYKNLGLVIADEQHRFGVKQRAALMQKGTENHALFMSATPIPRTLSMILYGDLDVSVIDEMPPGRKPVETRIVLANKRDDMYAFLANRARQGGQAYVVCPRIEGEEEDDQAAEQIYTMMKKRFSDVSIGLLHGKMKQAEKQEIMEQFAKNHIQILVSTTVVEVGVNVPNATVMVIERADRFGLAQLHQLRGRVGRGSAQSWCFLAAEREDRQRLLTMTQTQDGFEVAKADLELRGPGSFLGEEQHGFTDASALMLTKDAGLVEEVNSAYELLQPATAPSGLANGAVRCQKTIRGCAGANCDELTVEKTEHENGKERKRSFFVCKKLPARNAQIRRKNRIFRKIMGILHFDEEFGRNFPNDFAQFPQKQKIGKHYMCMDFANGQITRETW